MQSCFRGPQDPRGRSRAGRHDRVVVVMVELLSTCWCNPPHRSPNLSYYTKASISAIHYHQTSMWHETELNPCSLHMLLYSFHTSSKSQFQSQCRHSFKEAPDIAANQVKGVCDTNKERFNAQVVPRPNIWMVAKDPGPQRYLPHTLKGAHSLAGVCSGVPVLQSGR